MTRILAIAWKDLRSTMRNVPALAMMLLAPLALAGLLGFAFGSGDTFQISATKVALASADVQPPAPSGEEAPPLAGDILSGILAGEGIEDVLDVTRVADPRAARRRVDDGDAAVAVVVPSDFTAALFGARGERTAVELYVDPTQEFGTAITTSVVSQTLLDFNGARAAAAVAAAVAGGSAGHEDAARTAAALFVQDGGVGQSLVLNDREPRSAPGEESDEVGTVGLILAGMMVFFMFFGAANVARTILTEEQDGTLSRMLTTPTSAGTILGGKFASVFVTVGVQTVVLLVGGRVLFGIHWGSLDAVAILTAVGAAVAGGLALLIISVVRSPGQAGAIGAGVYLVLALLGGNFTGTATTSGFYSTVQGLTPNGWLLRGWDVAMHGGDLRDVAAKLLVPVAFSLVFFAVAVWRLRRRYA